MMSNRISKSNFSRVFSSDVTISKNKNDDRVAFLVNTGRMSEAMILSGAVFETELEINHDAIMAQGIRTRNDGLIKFSVGKEHEYQYPINSLCASLEILNTKRIREYSYVFSDYGTTAYDAVLERGCEIDCMHMIKFALCNGADIEKGLVGAARGGHMHLIKFCKEKGAINTRLAFVEAIKNGNTEIAKFLYNEGVSISASYLSELCGYNSEFHKELKVETSMIDTYLGAVKSGKRENMFHFQPSQKDLLFYSESIIEAAAFAGNTEIIDSILEKEGYEQVYDRIYIGAAKGGNFALLKKYDYRIEGDPEFNIDRYILYHATLERRFDFILNFCRNRNIEQRIVDDCFSAALGRGFMEIANFFFTGNFLYNEYVQNIIETANLSEIIRNDVLYENTDENLFFCDVASIAKHYVDTEQIGIEELMHHAIMYKSKCICGLEK